MLSAGFVLYEPLTETGSEAESVAASVTPSVHEPDPVGVTVSVLPEIDDVATPEQPVAAYGATPPEIAIAAGVADGFANPTLVGESTMLAGTLTVTATDATRPVESSTVSVQLPPPAGDTVSVEPEIDPFATFVQPETL
jgi:hypothetical protein